MNNPATAAEGPAAEPFVPLSAGNRVDMQSAEKVESMNRLAPRVVVGIDGSPSSYAALRWAVRYAGLIAAGVEAVEAWDLPGARSWSAPMVDVEFDEEEAERRLVEEVRGVLGDTGAGDVHERLVRGAPAEVLLDAAEGADVLVVGSRGRGGFRRALLGSVSQQCALHAPCPVVIVRPDVAGGDAAPPAT